MPIFAAIAVGILASPALLTGRYVDDVMHEGVLTGSEEIKEHFGDPRTIFDFVSGTPERHSYLIDSGLFPWWTYEGTKLSFWRPVTQLTHLLDYTFWPKSDVLMHLHNIMWWMLAAFFAGLLYRRVLGPGWIAGFAMLLYAIDDAYAMPIGWIANRNASIAACFVWIALGLHMRARESNQPALIIPALLATVCGLLSNEGAVALGAYLFAYAVTRDPAGFRRGFLWLLPYLIIVVFWRVAYKLQGFGAMGSQSYIDPAAEPSRFIVSMFERLPVLIAGMWLGPPAEIYTFFTPEYRTIYWLVTLLIAIGALVVVVYMVRRDPQTRFFALGMALALIPACSTFSADRLLIFAGFGAMGILARIAALAIDSEGRTWKWAFRALVTVHIALAAIMLPSRMLVFAALGQVLEDAALDPTLPEDMGDKTLVVASVPNPFFASYLPVIRASAGLSVPKYIRSLGPIQGIPLAPVEMTRIDAKTLDVTPKLGFPWLMVRADVHSLPVGWTIEAPGFSVEVMTLTDSGHPHTVRYRFDVPLEDDSLIWVRLTGTRFTTFEPPPIGARRIVNP